MAQARNPERSGAVVRQSALTGVAATLAVGTGLLLDVVMAAVFGAGADTDAFVAAARVPLALTAVFMVLGNQVLVPTFATWRVQMEAHRDRRLTTTVLGASLLGGLLVALLLALAAPGLAVLLAPGFTDAQHELTASLLQVMVLTIPLTAASEVLRAWLNARHLFVVPAAMTMVLNLTAAGIVLVARGDVGILPVAYVVGSATQLVAMLAVACWRGLRVARPALRDAEAGGLALLMTRPTLSAGLNPVARIVETLIASFLPSGSATILHYGNRLVSAVGGTVLFRSVMIAVLPRLTRSYAADDRPAAARLTRLAMRLMLAVSVPLAAAGVVLAVPTTEAVFGIGRFSGEDARLLGLCLVVLSLSFVPSAVQRALLAPFYAVRETAVPLRNTVYGVLANWALLPVFVLPLWGSGYEVVGIAASYTAAQAVNVAHARYRLTRTDLEADTGARSAWLGPVLSGALTALVALGCVLAAGALFGDDPDRALRIAVVLVSGALALGAGLGLALLHQRAALRGLRAGRTGPPPADPSSSHPTSAGGVTR